MKVSELHLDPRVEEVLRANGIEALYPPQAEAVGPALRGESLVLAIPTASGKSLVAYLAILESILKGGMALYIVPLRALASEKFEELRELAGAVGKRVAITTGDYDQSDDRLDRYDVIITTSEKADSIVRHRTGWLERLSVVVADEVHLIHDGDRGPTLEVLLVRLQQINPSVQLIALSATIQNSLELADWLGAKHVKSDWRPIVLKEGVHLDGAIYFDDSSKRMVLSQGEPLPALVADTLKEGGQCLVFVNTRKSTESLARSLGIAVSNEMPDLSRARGRSKELLEDQEEPTSFGKRLAECLRNGVAFHNAGLSSEQRRTVEDGFRKGDIKAIVATPTLAAGINLPARRVIIRDLRRYDVNMGMTPLPVLEVKQMCGRAGRPGLDPYGEAVMLAKSERTKDELFERYIWSDSERIYSKLGNEAALRSHVLALVATRAVGCRDELMEFINSTFFAYQGEAWSIEGVVDDVLDFLRDEELIEGEGDEMRATLFGRRTSDLYVDPLSAVKMRLALAKAEEMGEAWDIPLLHAICATPDMPTLYMRKGDSSWVEARLDEYRKRFFLPIPEDGIELGYFQSELKTALLLWHWINEISEDGIVKKFGVGPGDIRREVEMAKWLLYSMRQLGALFKSSHIGHVKRLETRVSGGIREELLQLVALKGIGRRRARTLFDRGYKTRADLKKAELKTVSAFPGFGAVLARRILEQAGADVGDEDVPAEEEPDAGEKGARQTKLF